MKLKDYLKEMRITQGEFAVIVGRSQALVSRIVSGVLLPGSDTTLIVAKATDYAVTPHELNPNIYPNPTDGLPQEQDGSTVAA